MGAAPDLAELVASAVGSVPAVRRLRPSLRQRRCAECRRVRPCPYSGRCHTCWKRGATGQQPTYAGPCLCGCGRPGRARSGYYKLCYQALWRRTKAFRRLAGTELSLTGAFAAVSDVEGRTPLQREALSAAAVVLAGLLKGEYMLMRIGRKGRWRKLPREAEQ